jgi:prevent-host-death family protein
MIHMTMAQAHNRLAALLKKVQKSPIVLTRRGKAVGVLISPEEYERLRQYEAYNRVLQLSQTLRDSGVSAAELYRATRDELEGRG